MLNVKLLGTGSIFPTKDRSHPSVFVESEGNRFLIDCGESTQTQMRKVGVSPMKVNNIFITHWHGDHSLGLGGIILSMSANNREKDLTIYGPKGSEKRVRSLTNSFSFNLRFNIKVNEIDIEEGETATALETERHEVKALRVKHRIPTLSYSLREKGRRKINLEYTKKFGLEEHPLLGKLQEGKTIEWKGKEITPEKGTYVTEGKKITYLVDTKYFKGLKSFSENSDIIISEATYLEEMKEKAGDHHHLTAREAGEIANESDSKKLVLIHFSQRYRDLSKIEEEAKKRFEETEIGEDLQEIKIK